MENESKIKHYGYIDALRGWAILLILVSHADLNPLQEASWFKSLLTFGQYGVQVFFIASALTLYSSYAQRSQIEGKNTNVLFFIRRFFRIAPIFYLGILFYSLLFVITYYYLGHASVYFGTQYTLSDLWRSVFTSFVFFNTIIPPNMPIPPGSWTVGTEMVFYAFLPLLFNKIKSLRGSIVFFFYALVGSILIRQIFIWLARVFLHKQIMGGWFLYHWLPSQLPVFAIGIILYYAMKINFEISTKHKKLLSFVALFLFLFAVYLNIFHVFFPIHVLMSIPIGIIVFLMSRFKMIFFNNIFLRFLGRISFSVYISHFAINYFTSNFVNQINIDPIPAYLLRLFLLMSFSMGISYVLYRIVEVPGINFGKKVIEWYKKKFVITY